VIAALLLATASLAGPWRGALDLSGGTLKFELELEGSGRSLRGRLCNGSACDPFSAIAVQGDSIRFELADYAASIAVVQRGDSLVGTYRNIGNKGPRSIPFRAARGRWPRSPAPAWLAGNWDAQFEGGFGASPRVLVFRQGAAGLEGTVIGNAGDYSHFSGEVAGDSVTLQRFDGSFVYLLGARLVGDTLRGTFHAGLRGRTPFTAVRSTGRPHLTPPDQVTTADSAPFAFAFPDLDGRVLRSDDPRFRGKVLVVDVFGTWCPTCHEAAPALVELYRTRHARGLEMVGLAYEVSGDTAVDGALVRRYRDKFAIPFPLLLAGINDVEAAAATLPQLQGFSAFPTTLFIGRDGRVRKVHAGFYGPATGAQHEALVREFARTVDALLAEPAP
jgi:thiol-disulfide isomerase/thioredoxin